MTVSRPFDRELPNQLREGMETEVDLRIIWQGVRQRLPLIGLLTLLLALGVYLGSRLLPPVYEATASLLVSSSQSQIGVVGGSVVSPLPADTVIQVLHSPLILRPVIQAIRESRDISPAERERLVLQFTRELLSQDTSAHKLQSNSALKVMTDGAGENSIYTLQARARTPRAAQRLADLASGQLLAWDAQRTLRDVQLARQNFGLQLAQTDRRLALPGLSSLERQTLIYRRATMQDNLAQLAFLESVQTGILKPLASALEPVRPVSPSPLRNAALAGLLTFLLATGVVALRTALNRTVRSEDELHALNLPVLATLPLLRRRSGDRWQPVNAPWQPALEEALGFLCVHLLNALQQRERLILMVVGTAAGEGASSLTAAVAERLGASGQRVLIVDGDLQRGVQEDIWKEGGREQIWQPLVDGRGNRTFQEALRRSEVAGAEVLQVAANVHLLPAGPSVQDSLGLLNQVALDELLRCWSLHYDLVLLDSPPLLAVADGLVLGRAADRVLLVTEAGKTPLDDVHHALWLGRGAQLSILGSVLNKVATSRRKSRSRAGPRSRALVVR